MRRHRQGALHILPRNLDVFLKALGSHWGFRTEYWHCCCCASGNELRRLHQGQARNGGRKLVWAQEFEAGLSDTVRSRGLKSWGSPERDRNSQRGNKSLQLHVATGKGIVTERQEWHYRVCAAQKWDVGERPEELKVCFGAGSQVG